jgi:uncharacterized protein (DUF1330 family)
MLRHNPMNAVTVVVERVTARGRVGAVRQDDGMPLRLCVLLWEHAGRARDVARFEDDVLTLLPDHGGRLLSRDQVVDRHDGDPLEVHLIEFPHEAALSEYLADPVRADLVRTHNRDAIVARTQLLRIQPYG